MLQIKMYHLPGEVIIARELMQTKPNMITIEKPMIALLNPMSQGLALIEPIWSAGVVNKTFHIYEDKLLQQSQHIIKNLEDIYIEATSSIKITSETRNLQ